MTDCYYVFTSAQDVIANVPPHWKDGIKEEHGSRWAGQVSHTMLLFSVHRELCNLPWYLGY
jgi:hypothetical protein